jgi:hypothetical protein
VKRPHARSFAGRRYSDVLVLRFLFGSFVAIVMSFPLAAATALVFRFPIPFGDYASGLEGLAPSLLAAAFYGMLGGFFVQGVLGGVAALIMTRRNGRWAQCATAAAVAAVPAVLILSVLDWIIGPW